MAPPHLAPGRGGDRTPAWPVPKTGTPAECHDAIFPWGALRKAGAAATGVWQHGTPRGVSAPGPARSGRGGLWPGLGPGGRDGAPPAPPATRAAAAAAAGSGWPAEFRTRAATGERGLVDRGSLFEDFVHDPAEPRRSGLYQFCVVGVDLSHPGAPRYHCWEPTGVCDRTFTFDEVEQRLAAAGRRSRAAALRAAAPSAQAEELAATRAVRWPDFAGAGALVHGRALPDVDARGRAVLPAGSRFAPRNSTDLLQSMVLEWKKHRAPTAGQVLVLDGTGRFAAQVQDELPEDDVVAIDDPPRFCKAPLRSFRTGNCLPVRTAGALDRRAALLHFANDAADTVVLPFVLVRLCDGEEARLLALVREALRVAREHVLLAEDVAGPVCSEGAWRRWKALLTAEWGATVLLDSELGGGAVPDHFLGRPPLVRGGGAAAGAHEGAPNPRRFLLLQTPVRTGAGAGA